MSSTNLIKMTELDPQYEEPLEDQLADAKKNKVFECGFEMQPGCEQVNGATGRFGYDPTNPIPVNGALGEIFYLHSLRNEEHQRFFFSRLGSIWVKKYPRKIDKYTVVSIDGSQHFNLYFDFYFERRSRYVPEGLHAIQFEAMTDYQRQLLKSPFWGLNGNLEGFPFSIPSFMFETQYAKYDLITTADSHSLASIHLAVFREDFEAIYGKNGLRGDEE